MRKLIGVGILIVVGAVAMLAYYFWKPKAEEQMMEDTSAASDMKGEIRVALDNWVGYFPIRSTQFKTKMRQSGWNVKVTDDGADYHARMAAMDKDEYDFAVATVDSDILNSAKYKFPGVIVMVIDESKGGDAIVARKSAGESLNAFRGQHPRVAFTPDSPSHHLLKAAKSHFSLPELLPIKGSKERVETKGSSEALEKLKAGATDVAVLWEPDVSRALAIPGVIKLLGTEQTEGYIVDVLLVNRNFLKEHKAEVKLFLSTYFRTLKWYSDNPEELKKDLAAETKLSVQEVEQMIKGVSWVNLTQNCKKWFGISAPNEERSEPMIVEAIESTVAILIDNGDFDKNPLPDSDPYKIFYTETLEELYVRGEVGFAKAQDSPVMNSLETKFEQLKPEQWDRLAEVGTFKVEPIVFQSGTSRLTYEGKETLDSMAGSLKHFPNFRVRVSGHTSVDGDSEANKQLSFARAESVVQYLIVTYAIDANRFQALGFGGEKPLPQFPDETERGWSYRLPRVELLLLKEEL